jgi:hypothetical protein
MAITLDTLDAACTDHLQHDAMAGADPLTDETLRQLQAAAAAAGLATAGQVSAEQARAFHAEAQPHWLWDHPATYMTAAVLGLLSMALWPTGCAG